MCAVRVTGELDSLSVRKLQNLLEPAANRQKDLLALGWRPTLAAGDVTISAVRDVLPYRAGPHANTVEALTHVNDDAHDLAVILLFESLSNSGQHDMEPQGVDVNVSFILVLIRPLAAVLVLGVLPLGADTLLEKVVVGLQRKLGNRDNIILRQISVRIEVKSGGMGVARTRTYVDAPELLNGVKGDNLLQQVVPILTLDVEQD